MAKLKKQHKELIVKELACYSCVKDVQIKMREVYGIEVSASQVSFYNPENNSSHCLSEKWRELFRHTRNEYKDEVIQHDISGKGYRLGMLQKMVEKLYRRGNYALAAQLLEQAAKEVGGIFEGKTLKDAPKESSNDFIKKVYERIENYGMN